MSDILIAQVAGGLVGRLRSVAIALDRLDRLESGTGEWLSGFEEAELAESATALALRVLRTSADSANYAILVALAADNSLAIDQLMEATGFGRLVLSERLNDLVQVGLATRLIDTDHAQITVAGDSMVRIINQMVTEITGQYIKTGVR
jgi:DNA-binding HxlR family transcriptional regulator